MSACPVCNRDLLPQGGRCPFCGADRADADVTANKRSSPRGPARLLLLGAAPPAEFVVLVDCGEPTPRELIARLLPDVLVKGSDWGSTEIVGRDEVEGAGGRVVSIPLEPGYSTTNIVKKIRKLPQNLSHPAIH